MNEPIYKTCPKCGYQRQAGDTGPINRCPHCGLYFDKWLKHQFRRQQQTEAHLDPGSRLDGQASRWAQGWEEMQALMFPVTTKADPVALFARAALWVLLLVWGGWFIATDHRVMVGGLPEVNHSIMHSIDLVFHEAGHVIFRLLGDFMMVLGGSLMQLLIPGVAAWALLFRHHDPFGASVVTWWFAQSLMDLAPYIYDAPTQYLPLLGGGTGLDRPGAHDWHNLLGRTGMLDQAHALAWLVDATGVVLMLAALWWGGLLLLRQYRFWRSG